VIDVNESQRLSISLATAEQVRGWSTGEVKKPETINYRTLKPEKDGLFCEKIFGPTKDWECACGKYKRVRFKGIICERCGVEVTRSKVRRERMGHIELAAPVTHIWYFKGVPSRLGYLIDVAPKSLEKVIYFASHLIVSVDEDKRHNDLSTLETELKEERKELEQERDVAIEARFKELETDVKAAEKRGAKKAELDKLRRIAEKEIEDLRERYDVELNGLTEVWDLFRSLSPRQLVEDGPIWRELKDRYEEYFTGGMGAEAVKAFIDNMDLDAEEDMLKETITTGKGQRKARAIKRLKVVASFNKRNENGERINTPDGMILEVVPVIPPDLRPMVQLDGGRFATSDLNDLYRRVINRNNRLQRLLDLEAPEIIINNEKRMLQEAVDALFDNGRRGRPVAGPGGRALKSLSDMLKGKQGRFRQNLLGKRVDYSGRSVIVAGPQLQLHQCGLPKQMALELFKPFVMKRLVDLELAQNIKSAKRMVERARPQVWDVLEETIKEHPVFLNRAPTLHRLGIQAFEPRLIEGKAIQLHPLVCAAFNADFDGDQMAVHVPLSSEGQAEARLLMLSSHNILSPASGRPLALPSQDMIIGAYYLTEHREGAMGEGRVFSSIDEAFLAYDDRLQAGGAPEALLAEKPAWSTDGKERLNLHAKIKVRMLADRFPEAQFPTRDEKNPDSIVLKRYEETPSQYEQVLVETTLGRIVFNNCFPKNFPFQNLTVKKKDLTDICSLLVEEFPRKDVADALDNLKAAGFTYATRSGLTISIMDVTTPVAKVELLNKYEGEASKVEQQYDRGIITDEERRRKEIEIWTEATDKVRDALQEELKGKRFNPIEMMIGSGARGNVMQLRQIAGMRGLVANPRGEIIPRPIKSNFREGLSVLEYFISTHGARKGLADTALRTADSGYLTRRLVDVSQELIVREDDCGSPRGVWVEDIDPEDDYARFLENKLMHRALADDVEITGGVMPRNTVVHETELNTLLNDPKVKRVRVRSVLTCDTLNGVCRYCYGTMLATGKLVELGEAIGIIAAQSIGEPGTQLTMRTFHTGGVAGEDITHGLPRVVELFEARTPKGKAALAVESGVVRIGENDKGEKVITVIADKGEEFDHVVSRRATLRVKDGDEVEAGDRLTGDDKTSLDPKEILAIKGVREAQLYLSDEVQRVYREQGVSIHDKHVEVIVRQMLRRVMVSEQGDSQFLPGSKIDSRIFGDVNRHLVEQGLKPSEGRPELMGITKASLATDSWMSAASFQETTRVLTEAAIEGRSDSLVGLKENVIIGKLIPAGTGMKQYNEIRTDAPNYTPMAFWSAGDEDADMDLADRLRASLEGSGYSASPDDMASFMSMGTGDSEGFNFDFSDALAADAAAQAATDGHSESGHSEQSEESPEESEGEDYTQPAAG
jgi:DNA-directed RNA polymerase subunit beta'